MFEIFAYSNLSRNKAKKLLFSDDEYLLDLFINDEKLNPKKFIQKLTDAIYSNSYISVNIQLLDYLGNNQKRYRYNKFCFMSNIFSKNYIQI